MKCWERIPLSLLTMWLMGTVGRGEQLFEGEEWESKLVSLENGGDELYYLLFKCRNQNEREKRLIVWFQGGPGCSGFIGNLMEIGPYTYKKDPDLKLKRNFYAWNEVGDVLFIDQPVGVGFSHMKDEAHNCHDEDCVARGIYAFFVGFFKINPQYKKVPLYLLGQSFAGQYIPAIGAYLKRKGDPNINLQGVGIGNGVMDFSLQLGTHPIYGYLKGLLSTFETLQQKIDALLCQVNLRLNWSSNYTFCWKAFNEMGSKVPNPNDIREKGGYKEIEAIVNLLGKNETKKELGMTDRPYLICNGSVEKALLDSMYTYTLADLNYLLVNGIPVMLYHGDKDAVCNYIGGELAAMKLTWDWNREFIDQPYEELVVDNRLYARRKAYKNLAFVRIYEAGHFSPYNQPAGALYLLRYLIRSFHP